MAYRWAIVTALALASTGVVPAPASSYVQVRDGVRLAVDVRLAAGIQRGPAALLTTRYGRATEQNPPWVKALSDAGIHFVIADARGTGASSGSRLSEFSPAEVQDIGELIEWIVAQPWSNGAVGSIGNSYAGDTSELAVATGKKALRAALVRHNEFDVYRNLAFPGGVRNAALLGLWGNEVNSNDLGIACLNAVARCAEADYLQPVGENGLPALRAALLEHQMNSHPDRDTRAIQFVDDALPTGIPFEALSARSYLTTLRSSTAVLQYWGSWMDAGTADSALTRFAEIPEAPMQVYLAPWTHGGRAWADPLGSVATAGPFDRPREIEAQIGFLSQALRGDSPGGRTIHYFPLGGDRWRETPVWPPVEAQVRTWYLSSDGRLDERQPEAARATDLYEVDFTATTGKSNRWYTQLGALPVDYGDRRDADRKLQTYTSARLSKNLELAGNPRVVLNLASSAPDAAVFVFFEDVAGDGSVRYITEGQLRLIHRRGDDAAPSFRRADANPVMPGSILRIVVPLMPVAAVLKAGHRLRIAIAGHDADTFARYPESGEVSFAIHRGGADAARLELPVVGSRPNRAPT